MTLQKKLVDRAIGNTKNLIIALEPFLPVLIAFVYFICNKDFAGLHYNTDEFGYISKMISLSGHKIIYPSEWHFGYPLFLLPVACLTRTQSQFWLNFVIYQSVIWCIIFYLLRYFINYLSPSITIINRFFILLFCAVYPSWCIMTGYAFSTTVFIFLYMSIIIVICRWNGESFQEPIVASILTGYLYWIHPLGLAVYIPLVITMLIARKSSFKRCVILIMSVISILAMFFILYRIINTIIVNQMCDEISGPIYFPMRLRKKIDFLLLIAMFFSHISTLGMTTLGAGFCGLSAACHQILSIVFKKITPPLPKHVTPISFFCVCSILAAIAESVIFFGCSQQPFDGSYYHWLYCRYLENFLLPFLVLCFLVKWKKIYFILPCLTFLASYYGLYTYVSTVWDNPINTGSLIVKNVCEYFSLLSGTLKKIVTIHLILSMIIILIIGLCSRIFKFKAVFIILFLCAGIIVIHHGLRWHHYVTGTARIYQKFASALEKTSLKNNVTWDSYLHRNKKHIRSYEFIHFSYPRAAFLKATWNYDTTEKWLNKKEGVLITDFSFPLLYHNDLYIYRFPHRPHKYIVTKVPLFDCNDYIQKTYLENGKWIDSEKLLYEYVYPLDKWVFEPYKTGIFFSASPKVKYLYLKLSQSTDADFYLNGKKINSSTGKYSLFRCFDVSNIIQDYNKLTVKGKESTLACSYITAIKLDHQLSTDGDYFNRFSTPYRLYVTGPKKTGILSNTIIIPTGQIQYGPYIPIPPGKWEVNIHGKHLEQGIFDISFSFGKSFFSQRIIPVEISSDSVRYIFSHEQSAGKFEFRCTNSGILDINIERLTLNSIQDTNDKIKIIQLPYFDCSVLPLNQTILFSQPDSPLNCRGFHRIESSGRWASKNSTLEFSLAKLPKNKITLSLSLYPLTTHQQMIIKTPDGKHLKTITISKEGNYEFDLDRKYFNKYGNKVLLHLLFPHATKPPTADNRILSCFFESIEVHESAMIPIGGKIEFNQIMGSYITGFSKKEQQGRWAGRKCSLMLPLNDTGKKDVLFTFHGYPLTKDQVVKIKDSQNKVLKVMPLPKQGMYSVVVPAESITKDHVLKLHFEFPKACKPKNGDQRILSFFFYDIKISQADKPGLAK